MQSSTLPIVIGSRSPRRLELLGLLFPESRLQVCPPRDGSEAGFDGLAVLENFERRILEIVAVKQADVIGQLRSGGHPLPCAVVSADTTVIVPDDSHGWLSLGQPPDGDDYSSTVRHWFQQYLAGRTHVVMSGLSIAVLLADGCIQQQCSRVCQTRVTMRSDVDAWLDWYIASDEPRGKAGGYAVQGAGSVFVTAVEGSFSNVVGLPLEDALDMFQELKVLPS